MKIKTVIFDSSTLIKLPIKELRDALVDLIKYYIPPEDFLKNYEKVFRKFQLGKVNEEGFFKELFGKYDLPLKTINEIREKHDKLRDSLVKLYPGANAVVSSLVKNYRLGLVSNMPREWFMKDAGRLGINILLFSSMVFGSDYGTLKPDKSLYLKACKELKVRPSRSVFVTNHSYEVEGAREASLTVITIGLEEGDLSVDDINGVLDIFANEDETLKWTPEVDSP